MTQKRVKCYELKFRYLLISGLFSSNIKVANWLNIRTRTRLQVELDSTPNIVHNKTNKQQWASEKESRAGEKQNNRTMVCGDIVY